MSEANIPLEFKSATLYALRAVLHNEDTEAAIAELDRHMADAGSFFRGEPVVIDASNLTAAPDWARLLQAFEAHELPVIGIVANDAIADTALEHGLHVLDLSAAAAGTTTRSAAQAAQNAQETTPVPVVDASQAERVKPAAETPEPAQPTMVVEGPLRSGQRVYARATDLVVMGVVSQGAEVIADGNIHVYGPLRGKAMAGARGDTQARIFTTAMDAELVAIAGVYRVIDAPLEAKLVRQPAVVSLDGQSLRLEPLKA